MRVINGKAVIEVKGVMVNTEDGFESLFGEVSIPRVRRQVAEVVQSGLDIILDINSPGGTVEGSF